MTSFFAWFVGGEQRSPGEESENLSPVNDMEENNAAAELLLVEDGPEFWQCISQNAPGPSGTPYPTPLHQLEINENVFPSTLHVGL